MKTSYFHFEPKLAQKHKRLQQLCFTGGPDLHELQPFGFLAAKQERLVLFLRKLRIYKTSKGVVHKLFWIIA